jgi:stage II sporulation protein GA (sporulation sigma-E factor processing peptidase)
MPMETGVYVDVLLVINYVVNGMLIACTAKLSGRRPRGRRIVAAALIGSVSSLAIFLPFLGFFPTILLKIAVSAVMVFTAFSWMTYRVFLREWFLFFAVTFCFAGIMLGLWMALRPSGMLYYNGVVYFDISSLTLLVTTVAAYAVMEMIHRFIRAGRIKEHIYRAQITLGEKSVTMRGLVDTGNSLREPFSGMPVILCALETVAPLLPGQATEALLRGDFEQGKDCGLPLRGIPYSGVDGGGLLPAFRADGLLLTGEGESRRVERVYIAISRGPIGGDQYDAILHPDLVGQKIKSFNE